MKGVIIITRKKKKSPRKWHRVHFFKNEKKPKGSKGEKKEHPAYIFAEADNLYKAIIFTRHPPEDKTKYKKLKYNVDPESNEDCYGIHHKTPRPMSDFQPPKKYYRIHNDDLSTIKSLKKPNKIKK